MSTDKCGSCGNLSGHGTAIGSAECALLAAHRADLAELAPTDRPLQVQVLDLYAHLRGVFPAPDAHRATRYVLELGWRPWVRSDA